MSRFPAVCAVVLAAIAVSIAPGVRAESAPLRLDDAIQRVVERHPDLRAFAYTERALAAERERAGQSPPLTLGGGIENALGTGAASGFKSAEFTLTLASVLERGGKRAARNALAASRIDALANQRAGKRLDLLAEIARRYLDLVAANAARDIARIDAEQRERTAEAADRRVRAGASPEPVRLSAQAALARATLERERADIAIDAAWHRLAVLWGEIEPSAAPAVAGDPLALPDVPAFAALAQLLDDTPQLHAFADEQRVREARLVLARSEDTADLDWQVGVRRLQAEDDWALVGSVSLPLGTAHRAGPGMRAAEAELAALAIEREGSELALYATLADAHGRYRAAVAQVERFDSDVRPALARAEAAAERAFRAGALSYLEWAQLQSESTAARRQQLDAAVDGQRALIEIQRLTAEPFVLAQADAGSRQP